VCGPDGGLYFGQRLNWLQERTSFALKLTPLLDPIPPTFQSRARSESEWPPFGISRGAGMGFFAEVKRRNVLRVAVAYLVSAWLLLQLSEVLYEILDLPAWAPRMVILLLVIGSVP